MRYGAAGIQDLKQVDTKPQCFSGWGFSGAGPGKHPWVP